MNHTHIIRRAWNEFIGPEATPVNTVVALALGTAGTIGAAVMARRNGAGAVTCAVAAALAGDLWGGVYVNNTRACARWYERAGQTGADHLRFAALHVHPAAVAWMDRADRSVPADIAWACTHYGYMIGSTLVLRKFRRQRRLLGLALTVGGLALDPIIGRSKTAPWFGPTYYPKLLLGHAGASLWPDPALAVAGDLPATNSTIR